MIICRNFAVKINANIGIRPVLIDRREVETVVDAVGAG
jgi:thiamine biosynthesis protein ThiC